MRCALLLDKLPDVDRSGAAGKVAEVYLAASLASWGLNDTGYKSPCHARLAPGRAQGAAPLAELRRRGA
jgi:hypothetical protein